MVRLTVLFTLAAGVFSFLSFQRGGVLPGVILALCAIAPITYVIASTARAKRNGGVAVPLSPLNRRVVTATAVVLVAGLAYSVYWMFWTAKPSTKELKSSHDLSEVCGRAPTYFPSAAVFTGSAPHPIAVFARSDTGTSLRQVHPTYDAPAGFNTDDVKATQLVACFDDVETGPKVGECHFDRGTVPVYQGRYRGKVVEAHTGKKVGDIAIDGASVKDCPIITLVKGDAEDNKLFTAPEFAEVQRVLGPFVDGQTR